MFLAFLSGASLQAQTGTINGTVVDQSGAVVVGAQVRIFNAATGDLTRETTTNSTGNFQLLPLQAATYNLKIMARGMEELDRNGVVLDQDQTLGLGELRLTIGQTSQTVTVSTETPTIDTT
ncbi:MAG: carboxypeptidase-like regulatory domain-containing protein, partial [Terracidiphilus sp.]